MILLGVLFISMLWAPFVEVDPFEEVWAELQWDSLLTHLRSVACLISFQILSHVQQRAPTTKCHVLRLLVRRCTVPHACMTSFHGQMKS